jgi:DNA-binding transcriptional LysR family regulator
MSTSPVHQRIRLTQLRLLVALSETGSLQRAAEAIHVTQPAATKALQQLEHGVGEVLVQRSGTGSILTPQGEILCRRARLVLSELQEAELELSLWHSGASGHVTIGTLPVSTPHLVPLALAHLFQAAPRITTTVIEGNSDMLFRDVKAGAIDLLVGRFYAGQDPELRSEPLYDSVFRLGVRAGHPLAQHAQPQWSDVLAFPWILPPVGVRTRPALEDMFRRAQVSLPKVPVATTSYLVMRTLMFNSDVICPMPIEVFQDDARLGLTQLLPFRLDLSLPPIGVVWLARRLPTPAARSFIDQLRLVSKRIVDQSA